MRFLLLSLLVAVCSFPTLAQEKVDKDVQAVLKVLEVQQEAWNKGDIDAFMEGYWKSDELQFVGGNGPTYGWQATKEGYKRRYPNRDAMGKLSFKIINTNRRDKKVISLVGKFTLTRTIGDLSGHFLLIFQKIKGEWLIVADFTASES